MYSLDNHVGRLIEARLGAPLTVDEVDAWIAKMHATVAQCRHGVILCVDLLRVDVLAPTSAERFLEMMRGHNPDVQRTGFLIPTGNAILGLQVDRLIRDAQSSKRKAFRDATSLEAWLVPVMTMQEAQQLRKFLATLG